MYVLLMSGRVRALVLAAAAAGILSGCGGARKVSVLSRERPSATISLPAREQSSVRDISIPQITRDTLKVTGEDGREMLIMNAVRDESSGEMVARDVLRAAVVTARFRNVAERHGQVDLEFEVRVPEQMQDSKWQLRLTPDMYILSDSLSLESVVITGREYRKAQMRGYQQYEKFLASIITDSTEFVNIWQLEQFIGRNLPEVYAFKTDTTFVSDEEFASHYGVTEREAIEHYTLVWKIRSNDRKVAMKDRMYHKYVKAPIITEGLRLDTVMQAVNGDFIYSYVQTVHTRPQLRKVDILLSGGIYEQDRQIYSIPRSEPLTFYISSLSSFVDGTERYLSKVIERKVEANTACYIDFAQGRSEVDLGLGRNLSEMGRVKSNLVSLMGNDTFEMDSIIVSSSASPEGSLVTNDRLSVQRSASIASYLNSYMRFVRDSLSAARGFEVDESGRIIRSGGSLIPFISRSGSENWTMLDALVEDDPVLDPQEKESYRAIRQIPDPDSRERALQAERYYRHLREDLYPRLRTVRFDFHLHRKGMVKDTVHTTVLDTVYMQGVQALRDRDYQKAVTLLRPYRDFNAAIAFCCMDYNASALEILSELPRTAQVNYMLAILHSRSGDDAQAVQCYLDACREDRSFVHRGNLDPEISSLIRRYDLGLDEDDENDYL